MAKKTIEIKCSGAGTLSITQLTPLQGAFKILTEENAKKLRKELLDDGFIEPISVWEDPESAKIFILNGHQRYSVLMDLKNSGYSIPQLPVNFVQATDLNDAKRKVLALASQYGSVSTMGLRNILEELGLDSSTAHDMFNFPEIDLASIMSGLDAPIIIGQDFEANPILNKITMPVKLKTEEIPIINGAKEMSEAEFQEFEHKCPKCNFEYNE